jgi:ActR/RegA family two-component response regulator
LGRRVQPTPSEADDSGLRVLLISSDEQYRLEWQRIFASRGWSLEFSTTIEEALDKLRTHPAPIVVYDSNAADGDWREALSTLPELPHRPCVLLSSTVIDENFRDEVVGLHGYDVLSRRADEDEISRTINSAWFWKHRHA